VQGDWLLHGPLDKPPLTIYADALAMTFFGVRPLPNGVLTLDVHAGEFAARVPGTFASILLVAVTYALAKRVYRSKFLVCDLAMLLAALSPYALAFSATAFTDGLMLLGMTLALWASSRGRALEAGIWLALSFWCKQQALFYTPLALALLWTHQRSAPTYRLLRLSVWKISNKGFKPLALSTSLFVFPLLIAAALLFAWDAARGQSTSLWALAVANNDPGRLAHPDELLPRLATWWKDAQFLFGSGGVTLVFAFIVLIGAVRTRYSTVGILFAYVILYFLLNWLIAFNIYDRYLLPLLPLLWLLAAGGMGDVIQRLNRAPIQRRRLLSVALLLCFSVLIILSIRASKGAFPIAGDHGENAGVDQLAAYLDGKPLGAIIYDHWLGWELGYYLGTWSDKRRVYYPTPRALAADALLQPDRAPRYFAAPADQPLKPWLDALRFAGFQMSLVYQQPKFVVYELIPPAWVGCVSSAESSWPGRIEPSED
jgi:4-amino-4-deoxy-L-arabinose transferase-like glycosyltransferase